MADTADVAGEYIDQVTQDALAGRVRYEGESATHCLECGDEIPQRRRELVPGVELCVDCQADQERGHV
ncbi:TraR/DksA C4-type zinc finger protein [Ectothiorhodospiraceae bacterium WFHF3C12]|nr:TraR/DksA C4-type zinc finger protein [Ectothiorhodospiraceae bacterium WFHF3C12]